MFLDMKGLHQGGLIKLGIVVIPQKAFMCDAMQMSAAFERITYIFAVCHGRLATDIADINGDILCSGADCESFRTEIELIVSSGRKGLFASEDFIPVHLQ